MRRFRVDPTGATFVFLFLLCSSVYAEDSDGWTALPQPVQTFSDVPADSEPVALRRHYVSQSSHASQLSHSVVHHPDCPHRNSSGTDLRPRSQSPSTCPNCKANTSNNLASTLFPTLSSALSTGNAQQQANDKARRQQAEQEQIRRQQLYRQHLMQQQALRQPIAKPPTRTTPSVAQPVRPSVAAPSMLPERPWYDPLGVFEGRAASNTATSSVRRLPVETHSIERSSRQSDVVLPPANPVQRPIEQVSYSQANRRPRAAGTASPELHKPWDFDDLQNRRGVPENPYRLVSDLQDNSSRTNPPKMNTDQLIASLPATETVRMKGQAVETQRERMPILNIGKDLMNEFRPSNDRKWSQNHAVLQTAEFHGNNVIVRNVRYTKYHSAQENDYTTRYYDATFDLSEIRTFDLIIVPFHAMPSVAHVEASFGFADGRHIGMSIEARYEEGEKYDPVAAGMRQFELIYVFADERDLIRIGTDVNKNDVLLYRLKLEPSEVREVFVDALTRANALAKKPEWYHPIRNSCVTNLIAHVNKGRPKAIPKEYRTLLPGLMDNYVYDLGLVDTTAKTFKEAKDNARVNRYVEKFGDLEYFSLGIRQNLY